MSSTSGVIQAIKNTKPMDIVNHPFFFAVGVGLGNGILAAVRGKHIDLKTGVALAAILGIGETVIAAFEPGEHKHSNLAVAGYSVLGVGIGLLPFLKLHGESEGVPIAKSETKEGEAVT
jgi:hypothetical protein